MATSMQYLATALLALNLGSFFWSVFGVFAKHPDFDRNRYRLLQINSLILYVTCLYALISTEIGLETLIVYNLILIFSLIGFWYNSRLVKQHQFSIVFSNDLPTKILKSGLYRFIRHPFYLIYLGVYFSSGIVTKNMVVILFSLSIFILYFKAARTEENKFFSTPLKNEYLAYIASTGMFFPKLFKKNSL